MSVLDVTDHGTPAGYRQGCKGRAGCDPEMPWTCADAMTRYRGDLTYRRRVDAGMSPAQIADADRADRAADRKHLADLARARREDETAERRAPATAKPKRAPASKPTVKRAPAKSAQLAASKRKRSLPVRPADPVERAKLTAGLSIREGLHRPTYGADAHGLPAGYARGCRDEETCPAALAGGKSCSQAQREYMRAWRAARRTRPIARARHGSEYGYQLGCRTDCPAEPTCTEAMLAIDLKRRRARGIEPRKGPEHGTRGGYRAGCVGDDCPATPTCHEASNAYQRESAARRRTAA